MSPLVMVIEELPRARDSIKARSLPPFFSVATRYAERTLPRWSRCLVYIDDVPPPLIRSLSGLHLPVMEYVMSSAGEEILQ